MSDLMDSDEERLRFEEREIREMEEYEYAHASPAGGKANTLNSKRRKMLREAGASTTKSTKNSPSTSSQHYKIKLQEASELSKQDYEHKWKTHLHETNTSFAMHHIQNKRMKLDQLEDILVKRRIYTLASGAVDDVLKIYAYAESVVHEWYLLEIQFHRDDATMHLKLKTQAVEASSDFLKTFEDILNDDM